jgi:hypothetical protein
MTNRFTNPTVASDNRDRRATTTTTATGHVTTSDVYGGGFGGVGGGLNTTNGASAVVNYRPSNDNNNDRNMNNDNEMQPSLIHYKTEAAYNPCLLVTTIVSPLVFIAFGIFLLVQDGFVALIVVAVASSMMYLTLLPRTIELYKDSTIRIKNVMGVTFFKIQIIDAEQVSDCRSVLFNCSTAFTGKVLLTRKHPIYSCDYNRDVLINPEHPEQFVAAVKEIVSSDTDDEREEVDGNAEHQETGQEVDEERPPRPSSSTTTDP